MLLTNAQMFNSITALHQAKDEKGLLGYAVAVNLRKLSDAAELKEFAAKRDELLELHGEKTENDGQYIFPGGSFAAFQEDLRPFEELTADLAVMQVAPEVFYGGDLTSAQMFTLAWMVKE